MKHKLGPLNIEIKNMKSWTGREGIGWQATFFVNGTKAFTATDDGNGGMLRTDVYNSEFFKQVDSIIADLPAKPLADNAPEWEKKHYPEGIKPTFDSYIAEMVDDEELDRKCKRLCKTKTVLIEGETLYTIKQPFNRSQIPALKAKYPKAEIVNLRYSQ